MAYTKYSLTPANNTATPPDGAPEGMLPSAVNDTMRDMMAQIRDCGDGIRDGTYTMTAVKITGGTITGVTLTGNTFSNPTITGVSTFAAGTVSAPAITTTGDTNTGIFFPAADTIAFTEGGAEAMRIDSSGNVGIGTSSALSKLDVRAASAVIANYQTIQAFSTDSAGIDLGAGLSLGGYYSGTSLIAIFGSVVGRKENSTAGNFSGYLAFGTNNNSTGNVERMRIDSSGSLLIGTTSSPSSAMKIYTSDGTINSFYGYKAGGVEYIGTYSNHPLGFATNNAERMRIDSSGNVLVGITSARANAGDVQVSKGISFPATQSAQSDANTLDDYEEGTFTPTVSGSSTAGTGTYGTQIGRYTKIGNQVTVCGYVSWSAHTGTGDIRFTNLPFTALNVSGYYSSASFYVSNISLTANNVMTASYLPFNQNYVLAAQTPVGGGAASLVPMDTAGEVIYTVTYFV